MTEQNNLPEAEDTKTRVTSKINANTPGRTAPAIDLETSATAAPASSTMTRRTMKLQGLAGMGAPKPAAAPAPAAEQSDDTRTRRTVKLSSLANGPAVKPLDIAKPVPAPAHSATPRRTQQLEALDTQDVIAMTEADLDTTTRKTVKISAAAPPPVQPAKVADPTKPRQTVKVNSIAPTHTPVIDLNAKPGDTNTRKTVKLTVPEASAPEIDLNAPAGDDTRTRKSVKIDAQDEKFKAGNVDDTVKLQRPAPKPAMPGSVAPASQAGGASAVGGIKLNKPAAAAKPAMPKPAPAAEAPQEEPTGNNGKNQAPPKEKAGLKVNTDAIKDLGSAPMVQDGAGALDPNAVNKLKDSRPESTAINVSFAIFATLAALIMIFVATVATTDYLNMWQLEPADKVELPILSDYVFRINK